VLSSIAMSSSTLVYRPLETARTIRVLVLHDKADSSDDVKCSLEHASLDSDLQYEALSYTWGDASDTRHLFIDGSQTAVTASLHSALLQFRNANPRPGQRRTLWADAICINQKDATEKTVQVRLMADIYQRAQRVLVWLGPSTEGVEAFLASLPKAHALVREVQESLRSEVGEEDIDASPSVQYIGQQGHRDEVNRRRGESQRRLLRFDWQPVLAIFHRPWFTRKWVIQEVALAREVVVCAGNAWFFFPSLGDIAEALLFLPVSTPILMSLEPKIRTCLFNTFHMWRWHYKTAIETSDLDQELLDLVVQTRQFNCTDTRDHLYSLLGLLDPAVADTPALRPDYECSVSETFTRFAVWDLVERQRCTVLSIPHRAMEGMPSWAPNLSSLEMTNPLGNGRPALFSAGGTDTPGFALSQDGKVLLCRAKVIDEVAAFTERLADMPLPDGVPDIPPQRGVSRQARQATLRQSHWMKACEDLATKGDGMTDEKGQLVPERFEQFWRTMLCEIHVHGPGHRADPSMGKLFAEYLQSTYAIFEERSDRQFYRDYFHLALMIEPALDTFSGHRHFCTTVQGRLGQLPTRSRVGDKICVVRGAQVPFVIRPVEGSSDYSYTLVGECYLHGVMDGEAVRTDKGMEFEELRLE
jgi:hypothetical protein